MASPIAVAISASLIPGATTERLVVPLRPISLKESMIPQTVPNSPIKGAVFAVVARKDSLLLSRSVSSDRVIFRIFSIQKVLS